MPRNSGLFGHLPLSLCRGLIYDDKELGGEFPPTIEPWLNVFLKGGPMKKFVALLLCLTLGFAIGCGGQAKTPAKPADKPAAGTPTDKPADKPADEKPADEKPAAPGETK